MEAGRKPVTLSPAQEVASAWRQVVQLVGSGGPESQQRAWARLQTVAVASKGHRDVAMYFGSMYSGPGNLGSLLYAWVVGSAPPLNDIDGSQDAKAQQKVA